MKTKLTFRTDGEDFEIPLGEIYRLVCCDCGLTHDVIFASKNGKIIMRAQRNKRSTVQRRRNIKSDIWDIIDDLSVRLGERGMALEESRNREEGMRID